MRAFVSLVGLLVAVGCVVPTLSAAALPPQADPHADAFHALERFHYAAEWHDDPVGATLSGIHDGDALLPDLSEASHSRRLARISQEKTALQALDLSKAPLHERDDRDILLAALIGEQLTLEHIQPDRHQPDYALSIVTNGLYGLVAHDYAPASTRLNAAILRLQHVPSFLNQASSRLTEMPAIYKDIALEDLDGAITFLQRDLPVAFASVQDSTAQRTLQRATQDALKALRQYRQIIITRPASGYFALGRNAMMQLLAADMVDLSPEAVMTYGEKQLEKDYAEFWAVAHHINPAHPENALADIRRDHPPSDELVPTVRQQLSEVQSFVQQASLISLPARTLPLVRVTPEFEQSLISAATEWPGPFEKKPLPSFYDITPPASHFSAPQKEQALQDFNRAELLNITVHEAMPGHFVQGLYLVAHPDWSLVRRNGGSYTTTEGWAHYTEQMMVEQGLDHASPSLHLMQLQDALLRDCRLLVSFGMHMKGMSLAEATELMQSRCLQSPVAAYKEARRGTADPGYFSYTLGKMMILHLRDDIKHTQGSHFSLRNFHDSLLNAGLVPMRVIRRELTGQDGSLL